MQSVSSTLTTRLETRKRKPAVLVELYEPTYNPTTGFNPADATERFATTNITWNGISYRRELKSIPTLKKATSKEFNNISLSFSNMDRYLAAFVVAHPNLAGMWAVFRYCERDITDSSVVLFIGRLDQPGDIDQANASLTAKASIGSVTQQIPWRDYASKCPLVPVFKVEGEDCQGFKLVSGVHVPLTLAEKPAAYQAAVDCDGSHDACIARENLPFYQGFFFQPVVGSFSYQVQVQTRFLFFFQRTRTRTQQGQYSSYDGTPYGNPVPQLLGRAQVQGTPVRFDDEGTNLVGWYAWVEGKLVAVQNVRNNTQGFTQPFFEADFLGDYGGLNGQVPVTHAGQTGEFYSRLAYSALAIAG